MVKNIVNAIVEQMEKENLLNIEMKEYFTTYRTKCVDRNRLQPLISRAGGGSIFFKQL